MPVDQEFNPASLIMQRRQQRDENLQNLVENQDEKMLTDVKEKVDTVILPYLKYALENAKPPERQLQVDQEVTREGRTGRIPRFEKIKLARAILAGKTYQPIKEETEITRRPTEKVHEKIETLRLELMVDVTPKMLINTNIVKKFLLFLRELERITPGLLNTIQDTHAIKRVEFRAHYGIQMPDGFGFLPPSGTEASGDQRLKEFVDQVRTQLNYSSSEDHPKFVFTSRALATYDRSLEVAKNATKFPQALATGLIVVDNASMSNAELPTVEGLPMKQIHLEI